MARVYFTTLGVLLLMGIALSFEKHCAWYVGMLVAFCFHSVIAIYCYFMMKGGGAGPIGGY